MYSTISETIAGLLSATTYTLPNPPGATIGSVVVNLPANAAVTPSSPVITPTVPIVYTTITENVPGTIATTETLAAIDGESIGTVIVENPTGGAVFTGPYTTVTRNVPGSIAAKVTLPPASGATLGTIVVEAPQNTLFTGSYTTITQVGTAPTTLTLPPSAGASLGTIIVETATAVFTGPYVTVTQGIPGSVPSILTQIPVSGGSV